MSVINNKGFVNSGVTYLQVIEKFPTEVARCSFTSNITVGNPVITQVGTSNVFLLNYPLVHTMTYQPLICPELKTTTKTYNIEIVLELTTPPATGTLPTITTTTTLDTQETFINTCGKCPDATFNKFMRGVTIEFADSTAAA